MKQPIIGIHLPTSLKRIFKNQSQRNAGFGFKDLSSILPDNV